jgi:hypothetical protein
MAVLGSLSAPASAQPAQEAKLTASDAAANAFFGGSVAISGDTAIMGADADFDDGGTELNPGAAYVFLRSGVNWSQQQRLTASDGAASDHFGFAVGVDGDTAIVGARRDDNAGGTNAGAAYVFVRSGGVWTEQQKLTASDGAAGDDFGHSVAVWGDTAVVGAPWDDHAGGTNAGAAYVFVRSGGVWSQQAKLIGSDTAFFDGLGVSVSVSASTVVAGARGHNDTGGTDCGAAYVFLRSGVVWSQQAKLLASDAAAFDALGSAVAVSGDTAIAGAYADDHAGGGDAGSAYVYTRSGGLWTQQQKLIASDGAFGDNFGYSVGLSGDFAVAGAIWNDPSGLADAGAAYVFTRSGAVWTQQPKLTASDRAAGDRFGKAVAAGGDTALIGAYFDNHAGGSLAGSAYVFRAAQTGACCEANGNCTIETQAACVAGGGAYQGDLTLCEQVSCPPPAFRINEIRIDQPSTSRNRDLADQDEFFELAGPPATSLDGLWYVVIGDGPPALVGGMPRGGSGVIEAAISLAGRSTAADGFFLGAEDDLWPHAGISADWTIGPGGLNFENNDNVTHLLVRGFTGQVGQDLDANDDGNLDAQPWTSIEDCVAVLQNATPESLGDKVYCATRVGPVVGARLTFSPGHVFRITDGGGSWQVGRYAFDETSHDTPGTSNAAQTGACCVGAGCTPAVTRAACEAGGGVWAGVGTACTPNVCAGACCAVNGACSVETEAACRAQGRWFRGGGTTCATVDCLGDRQVKLNEIWSGDPSIDDVEFIELFAPPGVAAGDDARSVPADANGGGPSRGSTLSLAGMSLVIIDGDTAGDPSSPNYHRVSFRQDFGRTDTIAAPGYFLVASTCIPALARSGPPVDPARGCIPPSLRFLLGSIENHSQTIALVRTQDLQYCFDPANPTVAPPGCLGRIDSRRLTDASIAAIAASAMDTVATLDSDPADHAYLGAPVVQDGGFQASYLQRTVDGQDTDAVTDWDTQWNAEAGGAGDAGSPGMTNTVETGACCATGGCFAAVTRSYCVNILGGAYRGNGSVCAPDPCVGACCVGGTCLPAQSPEACAAAGGAFMGLGVDCGSVCTPLTIQQAEALPLGTPVILDGIVVISEDDIIADADTTHFSVRQGSAGLTIVGKNAELDPIMAAISIGDTIRMAGTTDQFLGHFELSSRVAPLKLVSAASTGLGVEEVTVNSAAFADGAAAAEQNESRVGRLNCVSFVGGGAGIFEGGQTLLATDGLNLVKVFIPSTAAGLVGEPIPAGARDLRGLLWQADHVDLPPATLDKGYRLVMRSGADLLGTVTCLQALGACCAPVGTCYCGLTTAAMCGAADGFYHGNGTNCSPPNLCDTSRARGDIDGDGDADFTDVFIFVDALLHDPQSLAQALRADLDCSGMVDAADIRILADVLVP